MRQIVSSNKHVHKFGNAPQPPLKLRGGEGELKAIHAAGFSLVEVMIALVVLLLVFLALMQTALVSIDANTRDLLRDEAVSIAEQRMADSRNSSFATLTGWTTTTTRTLRNIPEDFTSWCTVSSLDSNNKQVNITVTWSWKGQQYNHSISSIMRNPSQ